MSREPRWDALMRAKRSVLARETNARLARFVNEELYPFSAHYRRVFDQNKVHPSSIRTIDDLRRLPLTTKQDLLAAQSDPERKRDFVLIPTPERIRAEWPLAKKLRLLAGGERAKQALRRSYTPNFVTFTTGRSSDPVLFTYTPHDLEILARAGGRMLDVHAIDDPEARIVNLFPFAPHLAFWQAAFAGFETGRFVLSTGGGKVMGSSGNIRLIERMNPSVLLGTPGFIYHLLREALERGSKFPAVKLVILGAEKVAPGLKLKMIESLEALGARGVTISGTYGFTEARMAFSECPTPPDVSPGYHLYPDLGVFEVIDPKSLEPVPEGADGELVYTPLAGHGTVVCRYRTGDLAVGGLRYEPCSYCGRTVPRIQSELRRSSDQRALDLTKIKGTLVDLSSMGSLLASMPEVEEWQVVLGKKNDDPHELDEFIVRLSLKAGVDQAAFEKRCRQQILEGVEVAPNRFEFHTTQKMNELTGMESEMKEKRFLDLRPK